MEKITLKFEDNDGTELVMTLKGHHTHKELRQAFIDFLRGIGYVIDEDVV